MVDLKELEENDWSLTPGRYVGVAPEDEDEDFDFEETIREIHLELRGSERGGRRTSDADRPQFRGATDVNANEFNLDQLGTVSRGRSRHRPRDAAFLYGGPYPFVQTGDVKHAGLYLRDYDQTYSEAGLAQSKLWPAGTLCITIAANIAETSILGIEACFPDSIIDSLVKSLCRSN